MRADQDVTEPAEISAVQFGAGRVGSQRNRIRVAAVQLFTRQGYAGTSMKQLASALGMAPANLYNYYPTKQAILFEVLSQQLLAVLERDARILAEVTHPVARLRALAYDLVIEDLRDPLAAFVGQHGVNGLTEARRDDISRLMGDVRMTWMGVTQDGVELGVFHTADPKLATLTILALCSSTSSWYNAHLELTPANVAERTAADALRIVGWSETSEGETS